MTSRVFPVSRTLRPLGYRSMNFRFLPRSKTPRPPCVEGTPLRRTAVEGCLPRRSVEWQLSRRSVEGRLLRLLVEGWLSRHIVEGCLLRRSVEMHLRRDVGGISWFTGGGGEGPSVNRVGVPPRSSLAWPRGIGMKCDITDPIPATASYFALRVWLPSTS